MLDTKKHGSEPKTFACAVSWLFFFLGFFFLRFVLAVCAAVAVTAAIVAVFAAVTAVPLTRREHPRESQEARARGVLSLVSSCSRALRRTTPVVSLLSWAIPLRGAIPPDRCRRQGRAEAKASRRFEPRSLDSESRVLTVTPRGQLSMLQPAMGLSGAAVCVVLRHVWTYGTRAQATS